MSDLPTAYHPLDGVAARAPAVFRPGVRPGPEAAAAPKVRFTRPSQFRYPISPQMFKALKDGARERKEELRTFPRNMMDQAAVAPGLRAAAPAAASAVHVAAGFAAVPNTGWFPYDCALAVGKNHVLCAVNTTVAGYDRAGHQAFSTDLSDWFAAVLPAPATVFDPRVTYDAAADKYLLLAAANNNDNLQSWFLLSVSQTGDPNGSWWSYIFDATVDGGTKTQNWADYPALGQDADAVYLTGNMFQWNGPFQHAKLRIVPKQMLYAGQTPTFKDLVGMTNEDGSSVFTLQPANVLDGEGSVLLINTLYPTEANGIVSQVTVWTVQDPLGNPLLQSHTVACNGYGIPPHADQSGGGSPLDTGDTRVMNAVVRDGFLWACFVTQHNWEGDATNVAAVFWVQIDGNQQVEQQGVYGASGMHYFYPAVQPVQGEGCVLVFSRSSPNDFASLAAASRLKADAAGTFGASSVLQAGNSNYNQLDGSGRNRWGDYSAAAPDPTDANSGWLYGGYAAGPAQWATWVSKTNP